MEIYAILLMIKRKSFKYKSLQERIHPNGTKRIKRQPYLSIINSNYRILKLDKILTLVEW